MKMPQVECPCCTRMIAAGIVAGAPSKGRIWRHDPLERPSQFGDALVSCDGSLEIIDLKLPGVQMELGDDEPEPESETGPNGPLGTVALF
ncbi:hypothetical protein [Streptomyces sp. Root369]|uniref:hypothetical protein n=1 Tax=Streptomyces sp. Root369 TaxID=1736523 RepID=UPI0013018CD5|nr:hypothetical protein [Streptomyces sp. Root369]